MGNDSTFITNTGQETSLKRNKSLVESDVVMKQKLISELTGGSMDVEDVNLESGEYSDDDD